MSHPSSHLRPILALALTSILAPAASAQSFQGIGDLTGGAFSSFAYGISSDGTTVVGAGTTAAGTEAAYWRSGTLVSLGDIAGGAVDAYANSVNSDGSIIVGTGRDATEHRGVRWDGPAYNPTLLPQVPGFPGGAQGTGISANGLTICGWGTDDQTTAYTIVTGYRIDSGVLTGLLVPLPGSASDSGAYATSADGNVIVGRVRTGGYAYQGCYWVGTTLHVPPDLAGGADYSQAFGVSADGNVLVGAANSGAAPSYSLGEPCRWENDVPLGLGSAPGGTAVGNANSCNHNGSIVVGNTTVGGNSRAFIWDAAHGMRELSIVLTNDYNLNLTGWTLHSARAITPDGSVIVGYGQNPAGDTEGWIARLPLAVPPATFCFGDGSGSACPCGNNGAAGNGCAHSLSASGAHLAGSGSTSLASDTLVLAGSNMPNSSSLYFQGTTQLNGGLGSTFGDGLRCAGGTVIRLGTKMNVSGASQYPTAGDPSVSVKGLVTAPGSRTYQVWYRNAATFCTASTFNLTNGVSATWTM